MQGWSWRLRWGAAQWWRSAEQQGSPRLHSLERSLPADDVDVGLLDPGLLELTVFIRRHLPESCDARGTGVVQDLELCKRVQAKKLGSDHFSQTMPYRSDISKST